MNEVAVITGAGKGIGRETALAFAREKINLALFTRSAADYDSLRPELDRRDIDYLTYTGDVSSQDDVAAFAESVHSKFGQVDYLINNAGIYQKVELKNSKVEDFDRMLAVNLRGPYLMTRAFVNDMVKRQSGLILFVSSIAGLDGFAGGSLYCASKYAIQGLAESLMFEVRKSNLRVTTICPGNVNTPMLAAEQAPPLPETVIQPQDVAETILHACRMPANTIIKQVEMRSTNPRFPEREE